MKTKWTLSIALASLLILGGCSQKEENIEYNKPARYWYDKIITNVSAGDLESADEYYTSLSSEHVQSIFLPAAILILAEAHIEDEEYLLANFYIDEFIKRYATSKNIDYAKYLKLRADFLSFKQQFRDQKLLHESIKRSEKFVKEYPNSEYIPLANTILSKLKMSQYLMDKEIADLYERIEFPEASKIYEQKMKENITKEIQIVEPTLPWYKAIFE
jgi:outer membrane protein assembly factor BamD